MFPLKPNAKLTMVKTIVIELIIILYIILAIIFEVLNGLYLYFVNSLLSSGLNISSKVFSKHNIFSLDGI